VDEAELRETLETRFGGTAPERRAVARAARDLQASGQFPEDTATVLSVARIVAELEESPDDRPADRWNWWMGALDVAYGGYEQFQVRAWRDTGEDA
jgi:hypothetical protein